MNATNTKPPIKKTEQTGRDLIAMKIAFRRTQRLRNRLVRDCRRDPKINFKAMKMGLEAVSEAEFRGTPLEVLGELGWIAAATIIAMAELTHQIDAADLARYCIGCEIEEDA